MLRYRRNFVPGGTYFFTVTLVDRSSRVLVGHVEPLRGAFQTVQRSHPFIIDAVVILPEHFHIVMTLPRNDADFSSRLRLIESRFTSAIDKAVQRSHIGATENAPFGNDAFGNRQSATNAILNAMSTISTSIRSSTAL